MALFILLEIIKMFYPSPHTHKQADVGKSVTIPETGTVLTNYTNTAESVATNGTKVILHGRDLWSEFHKCTTEMIITKAGRYVRPCMQSSVTIVPSNSFLIAACT